MKELGDGLFSIMVDESRDCSVKEQMAIVVRYVNNNGEIIERFLALVHVKETSSRCLKMAIDFVFSKMELSLSRLRGQGYDGASNMRGEFNGLKALILKENPSAWYVHCFAHQLQLYVDLLAKGQINSDKLNMKEWLKGLRKGKSLQRSKYFECNKFDSDCERGLASISRSGWDDFLQEMEAFCRANEIDVPNMDKIVPRRIRMKNDGQSITNYHYYRVEIFYQVVDLISQEMRNRFSESSTDLLECMACHDPRNHFSNFNVDKLVHLATLYPEDFSSMELNLLTKQLQSFVSDVRRDTRFSDVEDLGTLSKKMVETMKDKIFQLVYRLIKLVLLLPVATASVERVFSAMKFVKSELRNRMGDDWLNDSLTVYSENEVFATIPNERILSRFQKMDTRRSQLSRIA
ncbi:uncharacterized protein LOC121778900 [Salvia splendens]|uniref:uncharacterized protein LOC121778900 n=1 Tax=Salvia splendens TaxID=180675 RepID=UPI001C274A6A|nr:uncharacterized protein LOC121778900 [Salvia splendens]